MSLAGVSRVEHSYNHVTVRPPTRLGAATHKRIHPLLRVGQTGGHHDPKRNATHRQESRPGEYRETWAGWFLAARRGGESSSYARA
jgi:hypothetical protein